MCRFNTLGLDSIFFFFFSLLSLLILFLQYFFYPFFSDLPVSSLNFIWIDQTVPLVELCRCANPVAPYIILQSDLWIFGSNEGAGLIPLSLERFLFRLALYRIATLRYIFFCTPPHWSLFFYYFFSFSTLFFLFLLLFLAFVGDIFFIVSQSFLLSSLCSILLCELNATVLNHHVPILRFFFFHFGTHPHYFILPPPFFAGGGGHTHLRISYWRSIKF